jgi:hypothetical protein
VSRLTILRPTKDARHHGIVLRQREPLLSRQEMNGVILLLMSIDSQLRRLVQAAENGNGEERD